MKRILLCYSLAIALLISLSAASANAELGGCRAKKDKRLGLVAYSFNGAEGPVTWSFENLGPPDGHSQANQPLEFSNATACGKKGGKGRNCVISNDVAQAGLTSSNCKTYLYDAVGNSSCEVLVPGCNAAQRPPANRGYCPLETPNSSTACYDPKRGIEWYISPENSDRTREEHMSYLQLLNGEVATVASATAATDSMLAPGDLELPRLQDLKLLVEDCNSLARTREANPEENIPCLEQLCDQVFPAGSSGCVWSATDVADENQQTDDGWQVCSSPDPAFADDRFCFVASGAKTEAHRGVYISRSESWRGDSGSGNILPEGCGNEVYWFVTDFSDANPSAYNW